MIPSFGIENRVATSSSVEAEFTNIKKHELLETNYFKELRNSFFIT